MAKALSQDLRDRVVAAIDDGLSRRGAAARFGVSVSSAIRWHQQFPLRNYSFVFGRFSVRTTGLPIERSRIRLPPRLEG